MKVGGDQWGEFSNALEDVCQEKINLEGRGGRLCKIINVQGGGGFKKGKLGKVCTKTSGNGEPWVQKRKVVNTKSEIKRKATIRLGGVSSNWWDQDGKGKRSGKDVISHNKKRGSNEGGGVQGEKGRGVEKQWQNRSKGEKIGKKANGDKEGRVCLEKEWGGKPARDFHATKRGVPERHSQSSKAVGERPTEKTH